MDQSYSMNEQRKFVVAFEATAALAKALSSIPGTAVAAGAFSTHSVAGYSERINYVASLLKYEETACRMNLIVPPPASGTPMAEAIYCAAAHLLMRREPRRLLVVLTDGEPNDVEATQEIIEKCRSVGMEVYGVGIMDNRVIPVFGKQFSTVVNTIGELPERMFRLLANCLS
jgi:nitric oxide reductase activation protein